MKWRRGVSSLSLSLECSHVVTGERRREKWEVKVNVEGNREGVKEE